MTKREKQKLVKALIKIVLVFLALVIIVPLIGPLGTSTGNLWYSIYKFFTKVQLHLQQFWMIYTIFLAVLVGFGHKLK